MKTYEQQTLPFGEIVSTCSAADSPASRSASRASAKARRTTATSGRRCCGLFGLFDPVGSWARTFSELLIGRKEWSSTRCALTWKRQDTKCSRTLYRLAVSALPTDGTDAGLLPTVQTQGLKQCEKGKTVFMPLILLPTPRTQDVGRGAVQDAKFENGVFFRENKNGVRWGVQLTDLIAGGLLPTPNASEGEKYTTKYNPNSQMGRGLTAMAVNGMLPTPITGDYRSGMSNRYGTNHTQQLNDTIAFQTGMTSQLNPLFVAEMMGFPANWLVSPFLRGAGNPSKHAATP